MTRFVFLIIIDQLAKTAVQSFLPVQVNPGSFLGLTIGNLPVFSLAAACLALVILSSDIIKRRQIGTGEILILSGGTSNLVDRLFRPGVIDWINFYGLWFNLADVYITLGVTLWILKYYSKTTS